MHEQIACTIKFPVVHEKKYDHSIVVVQTNSRILNINTRTRSELIVLGNLKLVTHSTTF